MQQVTQYRERHRAVAPPAKPPGARLSPAAVSLATVLAFCALLVVPADGQRATAAEYEVKAAYLFNFGKFVRWPSQPDAQFPICVLGRDPFGRMLDDLISGEAIDGRRLVTRRITTLREAAGCRVVYVSGSEDYRLPEVLQRLHSLGILTVSDLPRFSERGGIIGFVMVGDRVRFEVNLSAARQAGLNLSSDLLRVATTVRTEDGD